MSLVFFDKIRDQTTTTGTSTITCTGATDGYRDLSVCTGFQVPYHIRHNNGGEWEIGIGTVSGSTLTRDIVLKSSNSNALVNFSGGVKRVFVVTPADLMMEVFSAFTAMLYQPGQLYAGPGITMDAGRIMVRGTLEVLDNNNSSDEIDLSVSNHWKVVLNTNKTLTVVNWRPTQSFRILIHQTGSKTLTWFDTINWDQNVTPVITTTSGRGDWYGFICYDNAPKFHGMVLGKGFVI